jgi:hypothetical protein
MGDAARPGKGRMRHNRRSPQQTRTPGSDARVDVGRHEAQLLWQLVAEVASRTRAPEVETLALDGSVAVAVTHGRGRRSGATLTIGLPLLVSLPVTEVRGLLASGLASSLRRHGRKGIQPGDGDGAAAELSGSAVLAAALVRAELVRRILEEDFWPAVFHGANSSAHPQVKPFSSLPRTLRAHVEAGAMRAQAARLFAVDAPEEEHESLVSRLRALGVPPLDALDAALLPVAAPAADLLGAAYEPLVARLDATWCERVDAWWEQAHEDALHEALGAHVTPARTWTQASALASYRETTERSGTPSRV